MNTAINQTDILVIGGGPGGSTVATLLAEKGWQVTLLDKEIHPRFHIGESLLPMNLAIFEQLGLLDEIANIGVKKPGALFVDDATGRTQVIKFGRAIDCVYPHAFQVKREEFDHLLLENTRKQGVNVIEKITVKSVDLNQPKPIVYAEDKDRNPITWEARYVVDATGNKALLANQLKIKKPHKKHQSAAIFGHFTGIPHPEGEDAGNITLYWFQFGWFWVIPLTNGITSVGAVCWPEYLKTRQGSVSDFFFDTIKLCRSLAERMQQATLESKVQVTGNFSYNVNHFGGKNYLMVGDSLAFIDPVFSSGVYLAMNSAVEGAEVIDTSLRQPEKANQLVKQYEKHIRLGLKQFSWFIFRANSPALRQLLLAPRNYFLMEQGIVSLLAGDVFKNKKVQRALFFFKLVYYLAVFKNIPLEFRAYLRRRKNARTVYSEASA